MHLESNEELARHKILSGKEQLIKNNNHTRDRSKSITNLTEEVVSMFSDKPIIGTFLEGIRTDKPRYIKDQLLVIRETIKGHSPNTISKTLEFCI